MHVNKEKRLQREKELVEAECRKRGFHDDNTRELLPLSYGRNISRSSVCAVMAGFGFSPQDIIQGIVVAKRICEAHFVQERRADGRYVQFGIEIRSLTKVLEDLEGRLSNAAYKYDVQSVERRGTALCDPRDAGLEAERRNLVGDFRATLRECEVILAEHSAYLRSPSTLRQNVLWEFRVQDKIDKLVNRVQFHISKITLVTEQLQDGLLRNMAATLDRIDRNVADIYNVVVTGLLQPTRPAAMVIPEALAARFNYGLMAANRPNCFSDPSQVPIQEGFDALVYHFFHSTVRSHGPPGSAQPLEQYINLVKARWLVEVLKRSTQFEQSFYYKRATLRMEQLIIEEIHRPDLTQYSDADFELVNSQSYAIWTSEDVNPDPSTDDGPEHEEQILELPLRDVLGNLTVYRMSETELRLVRPTVSSGTGLPPRDREIEINVHSHLIEPVYASPWASDPTCQVKISSSQVRSARLYDFKDISHCHDFQRAITGFKVVHDRINVQWSLDKKKTSGKARLQIWQYKPLPQPAANESQSPSNSSSDSSTVSGFSASTSQTVAESMTQGLNPSIFSIVRSATATNLTDSETVILEKVPLPVIVMFTVFEKQRTFVQLELDNGIKINPESCQCRYARNSCLQVVIENRPPNRASFRLSTISETLGTSTPQPWDISILGRPRHPLFGERVKSLKATYLALTFSSLEQKDHFVKAFDTISRLRNQDQQDYLEAKARFARRANQPNAKEPVRKASSTSFTLSRASTAPTLGSFSFGKEISELE